ncbi:MAG: nickel-dependent lactate racemase [Candidatus Atribacteria bacterium]|nr:nickel-dependent lactate racemase [Candidatus Atribacteria bacterium]
MMKINLKYGSEIIGINVPENTDLLKITEPEFDISEQDFKTGFKKLLNPDHQDLSDIAVVVSDKTRLCDYPLYLPWLLDVLKENGAGKENITFYIAYGTHPFQSETESLKSYGDTFRKYKFVHHDCDNISLFKDLGKTKRGTPMLVRKDVLDSSLIITFGAISHHYFAGFGGGRKLLFPGLAEKRAVYFNHSMFLNFKEKKLEPGCQPGNLNGNPVAEDIKEINDKLPAYLSIHGILNSKGKVCKFIFGNDYSDFLKACDVHDHFFKSKQQKQYDMVIASSGGYPKDINFIQAHKSIHHSAAFVKDGGSLIILTECRDGIGTNTFLPLFTEGTWDKMFDKLAVKYEGNGGTALAMKAKTERIHIYMHTDLDNETCQLIGAKKIIQTQINALISNHKGTIAAIENASMLVK